MASITKERTGVGVISPALFPSLSEPNERLTGKNLCVGSTTGVSVYMRKLERTDTVAIKVNLSILRRGHRLAESSGLRIIYQEQDLIQTERKSDSFRALGFCGVAVNDPQ